MPFDKELKPLSVEKMHFPFPTLIRSVNRILFIINIKAIPSANFIFLGGGGRGERNPLICSVDKKILSAASDHCINKFRFVNHDLFSWRNAVGRAVTPLHGNDRGVKVLISTGGIGGWVGVKMGGGQVGTQLLI